MIRNLVLSLSTLLIVFTNSSSGFCAEPTYLSDPAFGPYLHDMSMRIRHGWDGSGPKDVEHGPIVRFRVYKSGLLLDAFLWHHSGFKNLDQSFLQAVWNASPFRPLPGTSRPFMDFEVDFDFSDYKKFGKARIIESYGPDGLPSKWTDEKSNVDVCKFESEQLADVITELSSGKHEKADKFFSQACDPRCVETVLAFNLWHAATRDRKGVLDEFFRAIPIGWIRQDDPALDNAKIRLGSFRANFVPLGAGGSESDFYAAIGTLLKAFHADLLEHRITTAGG
jgi:hypothetical protein